MLKGTAPMESISSNLHSFLKKTGENLSLTDKKFLRDSLVGLIRAGRPVVCKPARHLPNNPEFVAYPLFTGLTEAINACYFWLHRDMLRRSLRQNPEV